MIINGCNPQNTTLTGLACALVQAGQLKEVEAEQLLSQANSAKISLIEQIVISQNHIDCYCSLYRRHLWLPSSRLSGL